MEVKMSRTSIRLDEAPGEAQEQGPHMSTESEEDEMEQPWHFWKWLIPIYASLLCVSVVLTTSYFITEINSSEFLIYIGDDNEVVWILLPTLPTVLLMVEYPFNMIPMDWPMLLFVELLFAFYILINFVVVACKPDHDNIYEAFDWYVKPGKAIADVAICMAFLAVVFAIFWALTQKVKLPRYANRQERRLGSLNSFQ